MSGIKVYPTIAEMLRDLRKAKIISLGEYRKIKSALGWKPNFEEYRQKLRWERDPKRLAKIQARAERKAHNEKVVRAYGLNKNKRKDDY